MVIPARNEADRIGQVLADIAEHVESLPVLLLVVDDGSSDRTGEVGRAHGARVIRHEINLGKGAAMKTGCAAALTACMISG